jgi:cytochrome c-type biogenesis protein CcmE
VDVNGPDDIGTSADSAETPGLDLSPREVTARKSARRRRRWPAVIVLVIVLAAGGLILVKGLTSAIDYYCNADEIGVKSDCDPGRQIRVQGTVDEGSVRNDGTFTVFTITFHDATIPVRYEGEPGGIFKECIPVVVRGVMGDDGVFAGDKVEVKHSNEYEAANPDRMGADKGTECSPSA